MQNSHKLCVVVEQLEVKNLAEAHTRTVRVTNEHKMKIDATVYISVSVTFLFNF